MLIARWSARLLAFTYDIQYNPGHENVTADCLSRLPLPSFEPSLENDVEVVALTGALTVVTSAEFNDATLYAPFRRSCADCLLHSGQNPPKL